MGKPTNDRVFPKILFMILQEAADKGFADVVSWNAHGKSFKIHNRTKFLERVLVDYGIHQSQYKSLVRQLNLWGFQCVHGGRKNAERGSYYHPSFLRGEPSLVDTIQRCRVKGKITRRPSASGKIPARPVTPNDDLIVASTFWEEMDKDCDGNDDQAFPLADLVCAPTKNIMTADAFTHVDNNSFLDILEAVDADIILDEPNTDWMDFLLLDQDDDIEAKGDAFLDSALELVLNL